MMKKIAAMVLAAVALQAQAETLTVVSFGGTNKDAQDKAFYKPFMAAGKDSIEAGEYNGEMARIRAMVETKQIGWDVVELETPELERGCEEGLFDTLDWSKIGNKADFAKGSVSECGAGFFVWSTVLTYDGNKLKTAPTSWADFWDVEKFPGKRALRKSAKYTLEIALMADGVKREDVYKVLATPAGVDRAFKKLDVLKPHIQWWESGAQPLQWLVSGDVTLASAYNGRIGTAQAEGHNFKIVWDGTLYDFDNWAIVKGSKHKALAEKFIAFSLQPENQKVYAENIPYGPANIKAGKLLAADRLAQLPTAPENMAKAVQVNATFWLEHGEELEQRFNAWAAK
ncbi:ABC transporter substrate-binding protein [Pantoea stewartii]|uniref:Spermidine/putrescine ABC transporter substrate-binding protein n=1 Tax=Pantoea stewartii TaxID=66269 RepID=A0AB34VGI3_9GAMM|nr:ABC transporter substrate-binding protein [Pantoea stewartii]KTS73919.1 spermidine/putrescine ABC transporter substrate-binding protein [Pantoea stewartii]KTS98446.1 spermidine/putrescine ABC transporter substrate-binding protein [Pantoea stewartii]KTT09619.1 spermidine/putrescine ABC transporter substrate-binding protein [Pantoea stewartii]